MASSFNPAVRVLLISLAATLAALTAKPALAQSARPSSELVGLDEFVLEALKRAQAPGVSVSIVKDGKVVLSKGYGVRSLATGLPMKSTTLFPIQSETKAFTGLSAIMLRDEGKLDLDAPVSTYIPGFRMQNPIATLEVSVRDFLTHRSGLGVYSLLWIANDAATRTDTMTKMAHLPAAAPCGASGITPTWGMWPPPTLSNASPEFLGSGSSSKGFLLR